METPVKVFGETLVKALCGQIFPRPDANSKFFTHVIAMDDARVGQALASIAAAKNGKHDSWGDFALVPCREGTQQRDGLQDYMKAFEAFASGVDELLASPIPDFRSCIERIYRASPASFAKDMNINNVAAQFDSTMRSALVMAGRAVYEIVRKDRSLIAATFKQVYGSTAPDDKHTIETLLNMYSIVLTDMRAARDYYLECAIPSYTLLSLITNIANKNTITNQTPITYNAKVPRTATPYFAMPGMGLVPEVPIHVRDVIDACRASLGSNVVSCVIAARVWDLYIAFEKAHGIPPPVTVGGGKKAAVAAEKATAAVTTTGGAEGDAAKTRITINTRFGEAMVKLVQRMANAVESITKNPSTELIEFLAEPTSRAMLAAFMDIDFPSNAYIPILSGFYRMPEADSRRKRYLTSLTTLAAVIEKTTSSLDGASKNAFTQCRTIAKEMIEAIESANREMEMLFAKLASGQVTTITSADTVIVNGREVVPFTESGSTGVECVNLTKALERLRETARIAPTKKGILRGIDKIDEYLSKGPAMCEAAVKARIDDLNLTYQGLLARLDARCQPLGKKVVEFKLNAVKDFYKLLMETETYMTKVHKSFVASPTVRDELYRAIAGWTLASQNASSMLSARFGEAVDKLLHQLFADPNSAIFSYVTDELKARRLGCTAINHIVGAAAGAGNDESTADRVEKDAELYDNFRRMFIQMLTYSPQLLLVFNLVNIIEKTFGRELEGKKLYDGAVRFIVAAAVDLCRRSEALTTHNAAGLVAAGYHFVGRYATVGANHHLVYDSTAAPAAPANEYFATGAGAARGANGCAAAPTESTECEREEADAVGIFFRHSIGHLRLEDELFVRWLKAICANLLLALDRDRATHGVKQEKLPGAERLLIGGAIDDPIGITGSRKVIPEAVPLYVAFPTSCRAYEQYFSWDGSKMRWGKSQEPRLIVEVPRSSRFYTILEVVKGKKANEPLSETYIAQLIFATNSIWTNFSSITDPEKRVTAILETFFDEMNNDLLIRMASEDAEAKAKKDIEKDVDAIRGIGTIEEKVVELPREGEAHKSMRKAILEALKGISLSVYDIMSRVNTSEETMAADYKGYVERLTKRIAETPEQDRFRELVRAMQSPDDTVGDIQGLFTAFIEFVITPLYLTVSITENVVYRMVNLYMQILRCLFAARYNPDLVAGAIAHAVRAVDPKAGAPPLIDPPAAVNVILARHWHTYQAALAPGAFLNRYDMFRSDGHNASHAARVQYVLDNMTTTNFQHFLTAAQAADAHASWNAFVPIGGKYYLHMYEPIYKALMLLIDAVQPRCEATITNVAANTVKVDVSKFANFIDDSITDIKSALIPFMKIGKKEDAEKYFRELTSWNPKALFEDVSTAMNKALGIVTGNFYLLRDYIPTAVCYGENCPAAAAIAAGGKWVVNFARNVMNEHDAASITASKAIAAYTEAAQYIIGGPANFLNISNIDEIGAAAAAAAGGRLGDGAGGDAAYAAFKAAPANISGGATRYYARDWTALGSKKGVFTPIVKSGATVGPGIGMMPWSDADMAVIEAGWDTTPSSSLVQFGVGLNTPALYEAGQSGVQYLGAEAFPVLNLGGWVGADAGHAQIDSVERISRVPANGRAGIHHVSSGNVIQSLLFKNTLFSTKAEVFNRLLAKMASCLTIHGDTPCILHELSRDLTTHSGLSKYFQTVDVTISADRMRPATFTCFPEAIGTPNHVNSDFYMLYDGTQVRSVRLNGTSLEAIDPARPAPGGAGDMGFTAPEYKSGRFIYDVVLTPFYNSATVKATRRLAEMTNNEMAKYLSSIPQFLAAFKALLAEVDFDAKLNVGVAAEIARAAAAHGVANIVGGFVGIDNSGGAGNSIQHAIAAPGGIDTIPGNMKAAIVGIIECLAKCYNDIREKYGVATHLEMIKGDFAPHYTAGKFDPEKITAPLSMVIGSALVDSNGPVVLANFGERGSRHTDAAMSLSWATPVEHKELVNMEVVSLESVPWTMALGERLKKLTNASLDTVMQPLITRIARLFCVQNSMNLTALTCHSPWVSHSVPSCIFHPHDIGLHIASMNAGFDLLRGIDHANVHVEDVAHHFIGEASLPWLCHIDVRHLDLSAPIFANNVIGTGTVDVGKWAIAPFPITYDVANFNADAALKLCYTANRYVLNQSVVELDPRVYLNPLAARTAIANAAALLFLNTPDALGNKFIDGAQVVAANPGALFSGILRQMRENTYEQQWLKSGDARVTVHVPMYGPEETDARKKYLPEWLRNKTKGKELIASQVGFKLRDGAFDGTYIEMLRFSPPKDKWEDELTSEERHMAGLFMYLKRNPISIVSTLHLVPFSSLYTFSEAFDMYFRIASARSRKEGRGTTVRGNVPSLLLNPLSICRKYTSFVKGDDGVGKTWLLTDTEAWPNAKAPYGKRAGVTVGVIAAVGDGAAGNVQAYQSIIPASSSIPAFYAKRAPLSPVSAVAAGAQGEISFGFCAPSNMAVVQNRALAAFPLFAMYVRMLDQFGVTLKEELATRLTEIRYDRPESLAQHENALISVLGVDA